MLATANGAGYRYGVSDQAFYIPAVIRALQPSAFPHDRALIDSQGRLMLTDDAIAALVGVTHVPLEYVFLAGYLLSLLLAWTAITAIGRRLYATWWLTAALAAAFTLRHRIPRTSANSFEPYFHPRMLAFSLGALGIAAVLHRRPWTASALVAIAVLVHVTTGVWFALLLGVAIVVIDRRFRRFAIVDVAVVAVLLIWAYRVGFLADAFVTMDDEWLSALTGKDLFPSDWPVWAWAANLALPVIAWAALDYRRRSQTARNDSSTRPDRELRGIVLGATVLVAVFLITLPFVIARLALPVQLQISRVFWLADFVALICALSAIQRTRTARIIALVIVAVAIGRGAYVITIEHPERSLFTVRLPANDWHDAMLWLKMQRPDIQVLAHPGHAWKYGTSVRVSAERDVFVEEVKDSAVAMYSRAMAVRYLERARAVGEFETMSPEKVSQIAARYNLDFLVSEADLPLPVAYRNHRFRIYSLTPDSLSH